MSTMGKADFDPQMLGVKIVLVRGHGTDAAAIYQWPMLAFRRPEREGNASQPAAEDYLRLPEDDARALYEALADYFGHSGNDVRQLRRDYDAERKRVDLLIDRVVPRVTQ